MTADEFICRKLFLRVLKKTCYFEGVIGFVDDDALGSALDKDNI